ncbi:MAG TPA: tRNA (guanosine(37)-N1)-methyltransferase TrmD [Negativicutes bacterium]|nr:MAG: tRNA (guanosine(37)-N1)-methyltransferase TrmD [Candidatus Staskawiczbacteria bacterium RIFCSPHIGHO2_02_FULL_43_16]OGZ74459.1 MAG: tRNA (guanosine(37)-N1)-methyltransferase TrmD [Candidatus Staskawiczbacteria bacterium RIFCSPLOWO2_01_FULL_43_17b]HLD70573.1 tRNA (guanosine(37)-N1)-methyltransferase TrmD [Negativicutes bacterium]
MIKFDIITIFPEILSSYLGESLIARARAKKLIKITTHNLRDFADDARGTVDDRPYGGGLGMVIKIEPVYKAVQSLKSKFKNQNAKLRKVILFTPRGEKFTQKMAHKLSKLDQIIFICGRYEGVDQRVAEKIADMEVSIGDYDLMGGELPAMVVIEAISRLVPGVLGKEALLKERITKSGGFIEYAQYTRPEEIKVKSTLRRDSGQESWRVPKVLLSGDHKKIEEWKGLHGKVIE